MGQARINRSNKPKPEANRTAKDATESHRRPRLFAWNPVWRKWRKSEKRSSGKFWSGCRSKLFRSLSSDPGFAKSQLDLTLRPPVNRKLIVSSDVTYSLHFVIKLVDMNGERCLSWLVPYMGIWVQLLGSSNGLVCISPHVDKDLVFLCNPTTRESKLLIERKTPVLWIWLRSPHQWLQK